MKRTFKNLWADGVHLLQSWLSVDRIRITPATGRLLQLKPRCTFVLLDDLYLVLERQVLPGNNGLQIVHVVSNGNAAGCLTVTQESATVPATGLLQIHNMALDVVDSDITIIDLDSGFRSV